jgi:hypothetical protein
VDEIALRAPRSSDDLHIHRRTKFAADEFYGMDFRMKTTLNIDDTVMAELKREAARQGRTMSELVETALRLLLRSQRKRGRIPALPTFRSAGTLVDIADRDPLYQAMEGR